MNLFDLALVVWVVGLLAKLFCLPKYPRFADNGAVMFWVGLLAWLLLVGGYRFGVH